MKKILVTGATGFIGKYVIAELLQKGHEVIATSSDEAKAAKTVWLKNVQYIPFNLKQFNGQINYQSFFSNPDAIIHLAWEGLPNYKAAFHTAENLPRHFAFIKNLVENGQNDVTITGTCLEYGMQEGCLSENMATRPTTAYAIAKDNLRQQLEGLQQQKNFHLKWVRLFFMYGAGQNPNSLLSQLDSALQKGESTFNMSGGKQVRDYLPVEKVAAYIVAIALQNEVEGIINCCSGVPITVNALVENYLKAKGQSIRLNKGFYPYAEYEPMHFWGNVEKLNKIIIKQV